MKSSGVVLQKWHAKGVAALKPYRQAWRRAEGKCNLWRRKRPAKLENEAHTWAGVMVYKKRKGL